MARGVVAHAEIDIIYNAKELEKFHVTRGRYIHRVVGRFRRGNDTHGSLTTFLSMYIASCRRPFVSGYKRIRVLLYGNLLNTMTLRTAIPYQRGRNFSH